MENTQQKPRKEKQLWCKTHPTGFWVEPYKQCRHGYLKKEKCEKGGEYEN